MKSWFFGVCLFIMMIGNTMAEKEKISKETAVFAGGCFWCVEEAFNHLPGVLDVKVGYTGGHVPNPTYEQVTGQETGHKESVQVTFDPTKISYDQLLDVYWRNIDPFDGKGQFCDKGDSYKAVIFYSNEDQQKKAEGSKEKLEKDHNNPILTEIVPAALFYLAEDYHQKYAEKNPIRYKFYRFSCGRDKRLMEIWRKK